jgi:RNA polymerase sigma-70 factor (ECF subfamily)
LNAETVVGWNDPEASGFEPIAPGPRHPLKIRNHPQPVEWAWQVGYDRPEETSSFLQQTSRNPVTFFSDERGLFQGACDVVKPAEPDTEQLITAAAAGHAEARNQLLERNRGRLRQLVAVRLDRRAAARVDPSDVVQEALTDAAQRLDEYLIDRPLPFYPWLRQLAQERLADVYRRHVRAGRRSVTREELPLPGESILELADRLLARGEGASTGLHRAELRARLKAGMDRLPDRDREVLVLRHLEQLSTREAAAVLGISEGAVKVRLLRALQRLRDELDREVERT